MLLTTDTPGTVTPEKQQQQSASLATVFDSKGNSFNVDTNTLDSSRPYAEQIPGSADYKAPLKRQTVTPAPRSTSASSPTSAPPFGSPEYTEWYYNDPAGPGYVAGNPNKVQVNKETGAVSVVNQKTGASTVTGSVTQTPAPAPPAKSNANAVSSQTDAQNLLNTIAKAKNIAIRDITNLSGSETEDLLNAGVDANSIARAGESAEQVNAVVDKVNVQHSAAQAKQDAALTELKPYQGADGNYNINQYLLDSEKSPGESLQVLRDAGFTQQQISTAAHQNLDLANQANQKARQEYSPAGVAKYAAHMVADLVVPGLSTAEQWGQLSLWQKIVYPALDAVVLIPVVGEAAKGIEIGAKGLSTGAELASLGGKDAVEIAAKDAADQLDTAVAKRAGQQALYNSAVDKAGSTTNPAMKSIYQTAVKYAKEDLDLTDKELPQLTKQTANLQKLSAAAKDADLTTSTGAKVYKAAEKVETLPERTQVGIKTANINAQTSLANVVKKGGAAALSGAAAATTIKDWKDLSPLQRVAGIAMTALPLGALGKARNLAEDVANPYKIPLKAIAERPAASKIEPGQIFEEAGGTAGGTTRLVIDPALPPEQARDAMASLMRQLHETGGTAKVEYAGHEITLKGTDFQKTVGGNVSFSGTPMGEIFKEGTGAFGTKTRLENYLTKVNETLGTDKVITVDAKYKIKNPDTGEMEEKTVATNVTPGVTVKGKEGGMYYGQTLYNKFSHQAAYGATGHTDAAVILHDAGIEDLPGKLADEKLGQMQKDAYKLFNGAHDVNEEVESFKRYKVFAEGENVVTNGSQLTRVQNLRSTLADKLGRTKGEYFTRDSKGKIELFQMYLEGGRTTPYTLKELYQLKGNALKNALADIGNGLNNKLEELKGKQPTPIEESYATKEEQISAAFAKIDKDLKEGKISSDNVLDAKRQAIEDARDTAREELRKEALEQVRDKALEAIRTGETSSVERADSITRTDTGKNVSPTFDKRTAVPQADRNAVMTTSTVTRSQTTDSGRATGSAPRRDQNATTTDAPRDGTSTREPDTSVPPRTQPASGEPTARTETSREQPTRTEVPRTETPRTERETPRPTSISPSPTEKTVKLPHSLNPKGQTEQTDWPEGTIVWNQGELGKGVVHHISPPPYADEYTSFKPPKGMKNPDLTSPRQTIQALGGQVKKDTDFKVGFETVHVRKNSSNISFSADTELIKAALQARINRLKAGRNNAASNAPQQIVKLRPAANNPAPSRPPAHATRLGSMIHIRDSGIARKLPKGRIIRSR